MKRNTKLYITHRHLSIDYVVFHDAYRKERAMKLDRLTLLHSCRLFTESVLIHPNVDPELIDQGKELHSDLIDEIQKLLFRNLKNSVENDDE